MELKGPAAKLVKAGAGGSWPSNVERDMLQTLTATHGGLKTTAARMK